MCQAQLTSRVFWSDCSMLHSAASAKRQLHCHLGWSHVWFLVSLVTEQEKPLTTEPLEPFSIQRSHAPGSTSAHSLSSFFALRRTFFISSVFLIEMLLFKKCLTCSAKITWTDERSVCLLFLGENHNVLNASSYGADTSVWAMASSIILRRHVWLRVNSSAARDMDSRRGFTSWGFIPLLHWWLSPADQEDKMVWSFGSDFILQTQVPLKISAVLPNISTLFSTTTYISVSSSEIFPASLTVQI